MDYQINLDIFSGPFDLLLHLIEKHEIDIFNIPIAKITEEYLLYLKNLSWLNIDQASEFLVMAATLMQIKAKMLLPQMPDQEASEEDEEDPRQDLVQKLLEYKRYKEYSMILKEKEELQNQIYFRNSGVFWDMECAPPPFPLKGITLWDLYQAFVEVLESREEPDQVEVLIPKKEKSIRYHMQEILEHVMRKKTIRFHEFFQQPHMTRHTVITYFLALLELLRLHKIMVSQSRVFGEIYITLYSSEGENSESDSDAGNN